MIKTWRHGVLASVLGLLALLVVGAVDLITGEELLFSLFYMIPITWVTWHGGRRAGLINALLSALIWAHVHTLNGVTYSNQLIPIWNMMSRLGFFVFHVILLDQLWRALDAQRRLATTDDLTGAANRRAFTNRLEQELARAARQRASVTLAYMDLDRFKEVNDEHGHKVGDEVLCVVVQTLTKRLRKTDLIARLGGDEFAILLIDADPQQAHALLEELRQLLLGAMREHGWPVTFSVGAICCPSGELDAGELLHRADDLMYQVKHHHKDALRFERLTDSAAA